MEILELFAFVSWIQVRGQVQDSEARECPGGGRGSFINSSLGWFGVLAFFKSSTIWKFFFLMQH